MSAPQPYGPSGQYGAAPAQLPKHPNTTTALVLGIIGLVSVAFCAGLLLVLSPFAWALGSKAVREIDANPGVFTGRGEATTARLLGIIGTVLLVLAVLATAFVVTLIVLGLSSASSSVGDFAETALLAR